MKYRLCLLVVMIFTTLIAPHLAYAAPGDASATYSLTCSGITVTFNDPVSGGLRDASVEIETAPDNADYKVMQDFQVPQGVTTVRYTFSAVSPGTTLYVSIGEENLTNINADEIDVIPVVCGSSNTVTWCNLSGDGRINGLCGDRIAVYCNSSAKPLSLAVLPIDNSGNGIAPGATFTTSDLHNGAGAKMLPGGLGLIAVWEANGLWYVEWSGGPYGANARGDFAKSAIPCKA